VKLVEACIKLCVNNILCLDTQDLQIQTLVPYTPLLPIRHARTLFLYQIDKSASVFSVDARIKIVSHPTLPPIPDTIQVALASPYAQIDNRQ
jgi:hypothetical protein